MARGQGRSPGHGRVVQAPRSLPRDQGAWPHLAPRANLAILAPSVWVGRVPRREAGREGGKTGRCHAPRPTPVPVPGGRDGELSVGHPPEHPSPGTVSLPFWVLRPWEAWLAQAVTLPPRPPPRPQPKSLTHSSSCMKTEQHLSVQEPGCWVPPRGGAAGKAPGRVGTYCSDPPAHPCPPPVRGSRRTLGACLAPLPTHRPFPGSGPCAGRDDGDQAVTAKPGAVHVTCLPGAVPSLSRVLRLKGECNLSANTGRSLGWSPSS